MSSTTSPSGLFGLPVGALCAPPTDTAVTDGIGTPSREKYLAQIGRAVAAAELQYRDRLALAVVAFGKRVQGGDLERGEAGHGRARLVLAARLRDAEVRLDVRPVVEAEHAFDDLRELAPES